MKQKIKKWFHDKLGWGFPAKMDENDSYYECEFCNRVLTQDSQGNWFHLSRKIGK